MEPDALRVSVHLAARKAKGSAMLANRGAASGTTTIPYAQCFQDEGRHGDQRGVQEEQAPLTVLHTGRDDEDNDREQ